MNNIIQWNCRGFKANFNELSLLDQSFSPIAFCLQETHLKKSEENKIKFKGYTMYNAYSKNEEQATGGSSLLVKNGIVHTHIENLDTELEAVAVRLSLNQTITLCSIYIHPDDSIETSILKHLTDQLPTPFFCP